MRALVSLLLALLSQIALAEDIFLQVQHRSSLRYAVLEDNGKIAFLYLTEPAVPKPIKDAVVYTRLPPVESVDWERIRKTGETPLLQRDLASSSAVIKDPKPSEFTFRWSADGHAVAVLRNGQPLAFATVKQRFGFSKAVAKSSSLANTWDQALYGALFE